MYSLLPVVFHQDAAQPMRFGLPGLQRQHQSTLRNLWVLCLLPDVGRMLQRDMHHREFRFAQLRRLRKHLPRFDADLHPRDLRQLLAGRYKLQRNLCLASVRLRQLRRVWL